MRAIIQRVNFANIKIEDGTFHEIGKGFVVYLGVMKGDEKEQAEYLAKKIAELRIFKDENDKMNYSLKDLKGDILIVSNFTISANCRRGKRPSFDMAASPDNAKELYDYFVELIKADSDIKNVKTGVFGAHMEISSVCDGPVNIIFDTENVTK